jgi:hypothetical protein
MIHRKDYKRIAEIIKESESKEELIGLLISYFKQDNLLFDENKFKEAIGETVS